MDESLQLSSLLNMGRKELVVCGKRCYSFGPQFQEGEMSVPNPFAAITSSPRPCPELAVIAADGWLHLPHVRFGGDDPGEHFYSHAFRFEEMFSRLIEPLARDGSSHLTAEYVEETATCYRKHVYEFDDVDLILLEGIFLFKRELQQCYDFRLWIDCSFKTALERALSRSQEGLPPADTIAAYERIHFPAERVHFERDSPRDSADLVYVNDEHLEQSRHGSNGR
jgi:uridine kinase